MIGRSKRRHTQGYVLIHRCGKNVRELKWRHFLVTVNEFNMSSISFSMGAKLGEADQKWQIFFVLNNRLRLRESTAKLLDPFRAFFDLGNSKELTIVRTFFLESSTCQLIIMSWVELVLLELLCQVCFATFLLNFWIKSVSIKCYSAKFSYFYRDKA